MNKVHTATRTAIVRGCDFIGNSSERNYIRPSPEKIFFTECQRACGNTLPCSKCVVHWEGLTNENELSSMCCRYSFDPGFSTSNCTSLFCGGIRRQQTGQAHWISNESRVDESPHLVLHRC